MGSGNDAAGAAESGFSRVELAQRLQAIERLPRRDQQALLRTIDRFLEGSRAS